MVLWLTASSRSDLMDGSHDLTRRARAPAEPKRMLVGDLQTEHHTMPQREVSMW